MSPHIAKGGTHLDPSYRMMEIARREKAALVHQIQMSKEQVRTFWYSFNVHINNIVEKLVVVQCCMLGCVLLMSAAWFADLISIL